MFSVVVHRLQGNENYLIWISDERDSVAIDPGGFCAKILVRPSMIIRKEQLAAFEADQQRRFENQVVAHLCEAFGPMLHQRHLDETRLRLVVRNSVERAETFGIVMVEDVTRFIEYSVEYGEGFESLPWAVPALTAADLAGDEKMDRLDAVTAFTLR